MPTFILTATSPYPCPRTRWRCRYLGCNCGITGTKTEQVCVIEAPDAEAAAELLGGRYAHSLSYDREPGSIGLAGSHVFTPGADSADTVYLSCERFYAPKLPDTRDHFDRRGYIRTLEETMRRRGAMRDTLHAAFDDKNRRWSLVRVPSYDPALDRSPFADKSRAAG